MGLSNPKAPELRVSYWISGDGQERAPLKLADLGPGYKILYCFQHWCEGCHVHGFPTLHYLVDNLADKGFGFAVIQTVFEGEAENTVDKLRTTQLQYCLKLPFGHDLPADGEPYPTVMTDYRTGGTPWFIVIDPADTVVYAGFQLNAQRLVAALQRAAGQ
jgi:hypothetical protein